jgi:signal transduction histidine kinase
MKIFKSELTLAFDDSDLELLYNKKTKRMFKYTNALFLSIKIFTILLSALIMYDAFPMIINKSFSFAAINLILIGSFGILIYHKTKRFYSCAFYTLLIQLIMLKALFGYIPSTYISLIECIPFFINSLPVGYYYIAIIIILRITINIFLIIFNRFTGIANFLNDALVNVLLILVFYFYTKLSKQALFYKHKFKKRREIFENIFNNVNIGFIEFKKNKVAYVNKYVLDVLNKVNSGSKFKDLNIDEKEKITEIIFSFFFDSKFEEEDVPTIDFRKLDNCRNDEFRLLGNRILSNFNIDLIEFEIWGKKMKNDNYIILLKECTNVKNLQEEIKKQLKFKSSFLSKVAHELKNPLISISELVEQLGNRSANNSPSKTMGAEVNELPILANLSEQDINILEEIKVYLKYLMLLIKDLSYNVNDDFELSKCDINLIIGFVQTVTKCLIRKYNKESSLRFIINIESNNVPKFVTTYEDGLKQILMNLITNAIKNTSSGTITLNITKQDDRNLKFQVDDTGMGFRLHDSGDFKQFTNNHQLGLYIIYDLTSKLGETIQYTSEVNKGSSFWFTIPIEQDTPVVAKKKYLNEFSEDEKEPHLETLSNNDGSYYNESLESFGSYDSIYSKKTVKLENLVVNFYYNSKPKKTLVCSITEFVNYTQAQKDDIFIIIVDDEKMARLSNIRLFSEVAQQEGKVLNILEAEDGIECLYYLFLCNKKGIKVSAIFSDQTMNYLDGSYILSILNTLVAKKSINSIPFYIVTAYEDEGTLLVLRDALPKEIYTKPLKRKIVEKIIKELYK